jgi:hypothetical protein
MNVRRLTSIREAKDFLAGRIVDEAKREGIPLSEIERKMLYFTESGWTLPDMMRVSEEFDRDYDQNEYEQKIGGLVRSIEARGDARSQQEVENWDEAVLKLSDEDHYLLVLINAAAQTRRELPSSLRVLEPWIPSLDSPGPRPPGDLARLFLIGFGLTIILLLALLLAAVFSRH